MFPIEDQRHGDDAALAVRADQRGHLKPAGAAVGVGVVRRRAAEVGQPEMPDPGSRARRDARLAHRRHEGGHAARVEGDRCVVAGEDPECLLDDQLVEPPRVQGAAQGEAHRGRGLRRVGPPSLGLVEARAVERKGDQFGKRSSVGALRPAEMLGDAVAQRQAAQDPAIYHQRQRGGGAVAPGGVGSREGGEAAIVGGPVDQVDARPRTHGSTDRCGRRQGQPLGSGGHRAGRVALCGQAHERSAIAGEEPDTAGFGAERRQARGEHHPRRVGRRADPDQGGGDHLQGGQPAWAGLTPASAGARRPNHAPDPLPCSRRAPPSGV